MKIKIGDKVRAKENGFCVGKCCSIKKGLLAEVSHLFSDGTMGVFPHCRHVVSQSLFTFKLKETPVTEADYLDCFKENFSYDT